MYIPTHAYGTESGSSREIKWTISRNKVGHLPAYINDKMGHFPMLIIKAIITIIISDKNKGQVTVNKGNMNTLKGSIPTP